MHLVYTYISHRQLLRGAISQREQYTQHFFDAHNFFDAHTFAYTHLRFLVEGDVGHLLRGIEEGVLNRLGQDVLHIRKQHIYMYLNIYVYIASQIEKGQVIRRGQYVAHAYSVLRMPRVCCA